MNTTTTNELKSAVAVPVAMAGCSDFSRVTVPNDLFGLPRTDIADVSLCTNFHVNKAQLIENGRKLRAALTAAGFRMSKAKLACSWHMGHPADWYYTFKVGV